MNLPRAFTKEHSLQATRRRRFCLEQHIRISFFLFVCVQSVLRKKCARFYDAVYGVQYFVTVRVGCFTIVSTWLPSRTMLSPDALLGVLLSLKTTLQNTRLLRYLAQSCIYVCFCFFVLPHVCAMRSFTSHEPLRTLKLCNILKPQERQAASYLTYTKDSRCFRINKKNIDASVSRVALFVYTKSQYACPSHSE